MRLDGIKGRKEMKSSLMKKKGSFLVSFYIRTFKWVLILIYMNVWQMYGNMLSTGRKNKRNTV